MTDETGHMSLSDLLAYSPPLVDMRPERGVRGWLLFAVDCFIVDVLRRCSTRGCWKHGPLPTLFCGRQCYEHWLYRTDPQTDTMTL